jgi:soluble lytic murein transglycosylase-like protein
MRRRFVSSIFIVSCAVAGAVLADSPEPFADFTFRRVKIPDAGTNRRITVQIAPVAPAAPAAPHEVAALPETPEILEPEPEPSTAPAAEAPFAWFWRTVPATLQGAGPGRLLPALAGLRQSPPDQPVSAPRLQDMRDVAARHGRAILTATLGTRVSPALVLAVIGVESAGRANATSSAGARGLMQLMPATAARFGVTDITDPVQNISGGTRYLDWLYGEFSGDPVLMLAAYNAGENAVKYYAGVPPFAETRAYVPKVLSAWQVARALCVTEPELMSDGCVFDTNASTSDG